MKLLLIAGIAVILAGLAAVGFGIPVKEFGFGNTLILTGTVGACTGLLMVSMALAVGELKKLAVTLARSTEAGSGRPPRRDLRLPPLDEGADDAPEPAVPAVVRAPEIKAEAEPAVLPWQDETLASRERPPAPEEPKRRNLMFQSTRRERERAAEADKPEETPRDEPWSAERPRADAFRRAARASTSFDKIPDASLIPDRDAPEPAADVTVLKAGTVDGMEYKLYSDGSIEARLPEGMMRFGSIEELREHLDSRGS